MIVNPQPLSERSAFVTEPGRRPINQDSVLLEMLPGGDELVIVADGMGGHAGGEVASRQALEVVRSSLIAGHDFESAVQMANAAIYQEANAKPDYYGMGTTLVGL